MLNWGIHEFHHTKHIDSFTYDSKDKIWKKLFMRKIGKGKKEKYEHLVENHKGLVF